MGTVPLLPSIWYDVVEAAHLALLGPAPEWTQSDTSTHGTRP